MGLKRIYAPVYVWVSEGPTDPGWGVSPPTDPGFGRPGWSPVDPGYGRPDWAPALPGHDLPGSGGHPWLPGHIGGPHPGHGLPISPGHPGNKPPGRPILPPHVDNGLPPASPPHIWGGGRWEILDPGFGKPPIFGLIPIDPGYGIPETPTGGGGGGTWVPTDPDYGIPEKPCGGGGKPHPPIWAWVPDFKPEPPPTEATPK